MDFVLTIDNPTLAYGNNSHSIWVTSADGSKKAVLMSMSSEADQVGHIRISLQKGIEVGEDFSLNNKTTDELKNELKESEDYIAVMKAQPVPPRKELSYHEKKVAKLKALIDIRNGKTEFQQTSDEIVADTPDAQLATEAAIMALTDSGIDVVEATDEMAMAVLGKSGFDYSFANSEEEFLRRAELAEKNIGIVAKGLNEMALGVVKLDGHPFAGTLKEARAQAKKWAQENLRGKIFDIPNMGGEYQISNKAIKKYLDDSALGGSIDKQIHLSALLKLPEIIENSVDAEIHPDYIKDANENRSRQNGIDNSDMLVHRLYGAVEIKGEIYRVKVTMYEYKAAPNVPHTYEVNEIEVANNPSAFTKISVRKPLDVSTTSISVANLLYNVEKSYDKGKKLLEESVNNPEFQIVYHGSGAKFNAFDHGHIGEGEGNQAYGWGTYVTEVEEIGKSYASTSIQFQGLTHELARLKERLPFLKGQVREEALDRKKRQAIREGGLILTLASAAANTPNHLSTDKVSDTSSNSQDNDILLRPETGLPNTNNALEGVFSDIKSKTRVHSGISRDNRKKLLDEYIKRKY